MLPLLSSTSESETGERLSSSSSASAGACARRLSVSRCPAALLLSAYSGTQARETMDCTARMPAVRAGKEFAERIADCDASLVGESGISVAGRLLPPIRIVAWGRDATRTPLEACIRRGEETGLCSRTEIAKTRNRGPDWKSASVRAHWREAPPHPAQISQPSPAEFVLSRFVWWANPHTPGRRGSSAGAAAAR